jgi:hypothetical protein
MTLRALSAALVPDGERPLHVDGIRHGLAMGRVAAPAVLAGDVVKREAVRDRPDFLGVEQPVNEPHLAIEHHLWPSGARMRTKPAPARFRPVDAIENPLGKHALILMRYGDLGG